jgi:hypothetical protein
VARRSKKSFLSHGQFQALANFRYELRRLGILARAHHEELLSLKGKFLAPFLEPGETPAWRASDSAQIES